MKEEEEKKFILLMVQPMEHLSYNYRIEK